MRQAWQPGDRAYVYYGGEKAFLYYARRYGFAPGDYVLGAAPARTRDSICASSTRSGAALACGWS
jgi:hypothetical protein